MHNKHIKRLGVVGITAILCGCGSLNHNEHNSTGDGIDSAHIKELNAISSHVNCDSLIFELVFSSEYECALCDNYYCSIDGETQDYRGNNVILIQIYCKDKSHDMPVSSLLLDVKSQRLSDITFDEYSPVNIKFNESTMMKIIEQCSDK